MKVKSILAVSAATALLAAASANAKEGFYLSGEITRGALNIENVADNALDVAKSVGKDSLSVTGTAKANEHNKINGRVALGYLVKEGNMPYGVELGFTQFAGIDYNTNVEFKHTDGKNVLKADVDGKLGVSRKDIDVLAVTAIPVKNGINIIAKAGFAYAMQKNKAEIKADTSEPALKAIIDDLVGVEPKSEVKLNKFTPKAVLGASYDLNDDIALNVNYSYTFGEKVTTANIDKNIASHGSLALGLSYNF